MDLYFSVNFIANVSNFLTNHLKEFANREKELEKLRKKFLSDFPIKKIKNLSLEEFTAGNNNRNSFCSRLENELKELGDMHGSFIDKFGVYYSNKRNRYECTKKWDSKRDINKGFIRIKDEIDKLLDAGKNKDYKAINANRVSALFKGKILATYYPQDYFPIFSYFHIKKFMDIFQIEYDYELTLEENKNKFLQIYDYDDRLKVLDYHLLMRFMYSYKKDFLEQRKLIEPERNNIPIEGNLQYINLKEQKDKSLNFTHNKDCAVAELRKTTQGNYAEELVMNFEKDKLTKCGRTELTDKVEHVSKTLGDGLGYDILSYNENGEKIYIEVKSKKHFNNTVDFYLTENEFNFLETNANSFIYYVYDIYNNPKIHITNLSEIKALGNEWKKPILYKIEIEAEKVR